MRGSLLFGGLISLLQFSGSDASAHVVIEEKTATAESPFSSTFRVGHGCANSPTIKLEVRIPDGVVAVEPQEKEGWSLTVETGPLEHDVVFSGQTVSTGIKKVTWSGFLPAHEIGAFVLKAKLSDGLRPGSKVYFPVFQQCQKGEEHWVDIDDDDDDHPAPYLTIAPRR